MAILDWSDVGGAEEQKCRFLASKGNALRKALAPIRGRKGGADDFDAKLEAEDSAAQNAGCESGLPMKCMALAGFADLGLGRIETLPYGTAKHLLRLVRPLKGGLEWTPAKKGNKQHVTPAEIKGLIAEIIDGTCAKADVAERVKAILENASLPFWVQAVRKLQGDNGMIHAENLYSAFGSYSQAAADLQALADMAAAAAKEQAAMEADEVDVPAESTAELAAA